MLLNPQYASGETSDSLGQKKAQGTRLCLEQKDGPFALSTGNWVYSNTHEDTLLGSLVVTIAALGSYIVTTTIPALPTSTS